MPRVLRVGIVQSLADLAKYLRIRNFSATWRPKASVFGFVHYTHAAATKFFEDGVMGNGSTDNRRRIWH